MTAVREEIEIQQDLGEIGLLQQRLEEYGRKYGLNAADMGQVVLALEEVVTNVIKYAFGVDEPFWCRVSWMLEGDDLSLQVEDSGLPFDPLAKTKPDIDLDIRDRPVGGLGIHIVRCFMDEVAYRREDGKNVLMMRKRVRERA